MSVRLQNQAARSPNVGSLTIAAQVLLSYKYTNKVLMCVLQCIFLISVNKIEQMHLTCLLGYKIPPTSFSHLQGGLSLNTKYSFTLVYSQVM
jgi:hypothetical protein